MRLRCCRSSVAPEIYLPNRRIGQWRRRETILECVITAFPQAVNYWQKDGRRLTGAAPAAAASPKHRVEVYDETQHRLTLSLRVRVTRLTSVQWTHVAG